MNTIAMIFFYLGASGFVVSWCWCVYYFLKTNARKKPEFGLLSGTTKRTLTEQGLYFRRKGFRWMIIGMTFLLVGVGTAAILAPSGF